MHYITIFLVVFILVFLVYYGIIVSRKKGLEAFKKGKQLAYFENVYKLKFDDTNIKSFATAISLSNAFIIAFTITLLELIDSFVLKLIVGFFILIIMILICYGIIGKTFMKKQGIEQKKKTQKK